MSTFVAVAALAAAGADEPTAAPTPTPFASPVAAPSIILITIAPQPLVPGKPVDVAVQTTGDVVAVHCEVWRHLFEVPKSGPGTASNLVDREFRPIVEAAGISDEFRFQRPAPIARDAASERRHEPQGRPGAARPRVGQDDARPLRTRA